MSSLDSQSYDWVVLGDSPAALLSAALVARLGLSVLICGGSGIQKWGISSNSQLIDPEPNWITGVGHPTSELAMAGICLQACHFSDSDWSLVQTQEPLFQVLTPRVRADFFSDPECTLREVRRELGDSHSMVHGLIFAHQSGSSLVRSYWNELSNRLTVPLDLEPKKKREITKRSSDTEREFFRKLIREIPKTPMSALWSSYQSSPSDLVHIETEREWITGWAVGALGAELPQDCAPFEVLQALGLSSSGISFSGGMSEFRRALLRVAVQFGAKVMDSEFDRVSLIIREKRVLGVRLYDRAQKEWVIHARGISSSLSPSVFSEEGFKVGEQRVRVTLACTLPKSAIPVGLARRSFWCETGAPPIELERSLPEEYGILSQDCESLFIRSSFPLNSFSWSVDRWKTVLGRMFKQTSEVLPFLEERVSRVFPDFRSVHFVDHWNEFYGGGKLSQWDGFRVPVSSNPESDPSPYEGFFQVHRSLNPSLGWVGEWSSVLASTAWIAHRSGLPGPLS